MKQVADLRNYSKALAEQPNIAANICRILGGLDGNKITRKYLLDHSELVVTQRSDTVKTIKNMVDIGLLTEINDLLELTIDKENYKNLTFMFEGMALGKNINSESLIEIVLTRPKKPSELDRILKQKGPSVIRIENTIDSFKHLAFSSKKRLVIMTPFLDVDGAEWVRSLFDNTKDDVEKILIIRFLNKDKDYILYPKGYHEISGYLSEKNIKVCNFALERKGTSLLETFHAKCILCDDEMAYIGSSNLTYHSLDNSMELGVMIKGSEVRLVSIIVDAILEICDENEE